MPIELPFAKDLCFTGDYDQQFVYGLEVVLIGFERAEGLSEFLRTLVLRMPKA